jgi:hypothetical protein
MTTIFLYGLAKSYNTIPSGYVFKDKALEQRIYKVMEHFELDDIELNVKLTDEFPPFCNFGKMPDEKELAEKIRQAIEFLNGNSEKL